MFNNQEVLVSIAIPFYNTEKYLDLAIQSIIDQTYQNWRLLLINDGSTDASLAIARKYENDPRVTIYSDGQNKNMSFRLNEFAKIVTTKYLARMDADDIMHPKKIEKQIQLLESHPEIDVLGTNAYSINENSIVEGIRLKFPKGEELSKVNTFIHPTIIAKTAWFIANPYDIKIERIDDKELWFRTHKKYNFQILTEPLFFYREFGNDYYKKYFKGFKYLLYALKKHHYNLDFLKFGIQYSIAGVVYCLFNLVGKESILVSRRNAINVDKLTIEEVLKKGQ
ncbi:glycosyltransferase family 2 protein [Flavobacterium franklandianum]|uniref:glycosyltransferase family 2 protein n=1 Tax=Flavobacterium franklandianum TaxID=2594430 RepID=UPI00117A55FA|nr:glycosyltransferase family A protein [Flavobacterium franklandianum]TRX29452.1 glycosyltransferase family 2 protein [Flavobacterium franklandianum]